MRLPQSPQFYAIVITAVTLAAYGGTMDVPFLFDDSISILENPTIRRLTDLSAVFSPPAAAGTGGRPLANFTLALSYAISGIAPWGYHGLNLAIHLAAALALFGVIRRTLQSGNVSQPLRDDANLLAGAIAALWAAHPLQTQTVTYLSQRTESLMALFYLLTLYGFVRGVAAARSAPWFVGAVVACWCGALCKEVIATAPLLVLLYDRTFVAGSVAAAWRQRWRLYAGLAVTWLWLAMLLVGVGERGVGPGLGVSWFDYALTQCKAVVLYALLGLWPAPLIFDRGPFFLTSIAAALPYAAVLAMALAATIWGVRRARPWGFAAASFFLILAPTSSVVPIIQAPIAENRAYLPLAAILTGSVILLRLAAGRRTTLAVGSLLVMAAVVATVQRNRTYASEITLWKDTIAKLPENHRAHNNLGHILAAQPGRAGEAAAHFEQAVRLEPNDADSHNNLAVILAAQPGRHAEAIAHYEKALAIIPGRAVTHLNLANLLTTRPGRQLDALRHYQIALQLDPTLAVGHNNLGLLLGSQLGRESEAIRHYAAALQLQPRYYEARNNLAVLLARQPGRQAEAIAHYEQVLRERPDYAEAHNNLAVLLASQSGRQADAITHYETALRLNPRRPEVHNNLALLLAGQPGRQRDAIAHFESASQLMPDSAVIHLNLARELEKLSDRQSDAARHYEAALRLSPDLREAATALERLRRQ